MEEHYLELVKNAQNPENNPHYPGNIRHSGALRALYDNCGEDADLAIALDKTVRESIEDDFRHNEFKERRVKQALYAVLLVKFASDAKAQSEVERILIIA